MSLQSTTAGADEHSWTQRHTQFGCDRRVSQTAVSLSSFTSNEHRTSVVSVSAAASGSKAGEDNSTVMSVRLQVLCHNLRLVQWTANVRYSSQDHTTTTTTSTHTYTHTHTHTRTHSLTNNYTHAHVLLLTYYAALQLANHIMHCCWSVRHAVCLGFIFKNEKSRKVPRHEQSRSLDAQRPKLKVTKPCNVLA